MYFFLLEVVADPAKNPVAKPVDNSTEPDSEEKTGITVNQTKIDYQLKASITQISLSGEVTVKFSNPIYKPENF